MLKRMLGDDETRLPGRVRDAIQKQSDETERLIGWIQLAVVLTFALLYAISPKTFPAEQTFRPVPWVIGAYTLFTVLRLILAYRISLPSWFLVVSIMLDMALLFGLIWSFHIQYMQPASFYLKAPTLLYVFIFIALRALRLEARFVIAAGLAAALGWLVLVIYVITIDPRDTMITRDYVAYMTSNSILIGAEFDKVVSILVVSLILGIALVRGRTLLVRAVTEGVAARELSRFFAPEIARRIRASESEITVGGGESRDAAILVLDLRGFTRFAATQSPDAVMGLLGEYQRRMVQVIQAHGGSIDKFLGDGIMATFGAALPSETYAADALRALEQALAEAKDWCAAKEAAGLLCPHVNGAVATGRIMFGAVGDESRLEYTVIGDAVNRSAKLEHHNKALGTRGLTDVATFERAQAQGYAPADGKRRIAGVEVAGLQDSLDLVVVVA